MKITQELNGKDLTLSLDGYLDTGTSPELKQVLNAHMTMSTKGGMKILHVNDEVLDTMKITGMVNVLNIVQN